MRAGARSSPLSRAQLEEVEHETGLQFETIWVETTGDKDRATSLRILDKTDFFTRELDEMLLRGEIDLAIHSAKDLPEPLHHGLLIAAITLGVDSRDCLVLRDGETLESLSSCAIVATSSARREESVRSLRSDLRFIDLRGTIGERLQKLETGEADAVVLAEAALIRLKLTHLNRIYRPGETAPMQGRLAIVVRSDRRDLMTLFAGIYDPVSRP